MNVALLAALAAYIPRDRVESLIHPGTLLPEDGVALIADISGFTPLTEALTHGLSPDQGAEELTRVLEGVFTPLIEEIHAFHGNVIKFGGDALIVWYPREPGVRRAAVIRRAITSAWRMQQAIQIHGQVPTPIGLITLQMKIGLAYGPVKRFNLGLPEYGYEDVLGGATLDRMAEAEQHANSGEIIVDAATLAYLPNAVTVAEWHVGFAVIGQLLRPARTKPWPALTWPSEIERSLIERLAAYVPSQIYQTLAAGQAQMAELKPVVSLFVQFHGIDYDTDPEVEAKLQTYFSAAQQVAGRYGGRLNRLITGDKGSLIHVIFGAPRTVEEQEARAIRCALDLQAECGRLPFIAMQRIGVASGRVFAGPVGSPHRHDYTTIGDSINLSNRLMQNAASNQVLLEAAVRRQLGPEFELAELDSIRVKGKSQPIPVFAALSVQTFTDRLGHKGSERPIRPLFGRANELALLQERLVQLAGGQGGIIIVTGEVGIGKTHLLESVRLQAPEPLVWASGISLAYGQSLSGYLFIEVLRDLIELPPGLSPTEASQHLRYFCADLFGGARLAATYPYLARFMGLPLETENAQRMEGLAGESLRWQFFEVIRELLLLLLQRHPLALVLDDLQWAGPTSLQLIEMILPLTVDQPCLLLLAMRPERDSQAWALRQNILAAPPAPGQALEITLHPLERRAAAALVAHDAPGLPEGLVAYLVDKGGGNPLFLVEMVRILQARGLLSGEVNLAQISLEALDLPDSVQGVLLAQIDRLAVEARHTLQLAAVIGETFFHKVLAGLATSEQALFRQLGFLEAEEYIRPIEPTDLGTAHTFRHTLIQESAYSTLLYERRRAYHRQVAEILERLFPAYLAQQAGLLGFHYERAGDLDQAIYYHLQAADQARLLYANEEAETLYHKVLKLIDQAEADGADIRERRAKTYLKIAQVQTNRLDFMGAQGFYDLAFTLLEQLGQAPQLVENDRERIFRWGVLNHGPSTLDPGLSEIEDVSEIINHLFEGLVELDSELNVIPALARRWAIEEEGRRYRFELRPNLKWSDGTPLTAHDFVFAWRRNLHPDTGAGLAQQLYVVQGAEEFHQGKNDDPNSVAVKALDDSNLEVTLKSPASYFPYLLAVSITYPQPTHVIQAKSRDWSLPDNLVCNGPFKIGNWQAGQAIYLEKNPLYHGFAAGNLEQVRLYFIESSLDNYLANNIDWCRVEDQADLPHRYPQETLLAQYLETYFLGFACHCSPFNHRLVRQAFATSINQTALTQEVWANVHKPALGGVIPPGMPGHSPEIGLPFDPARARDLLNQASFSSGADLPPLTLAALPGFKAAPHYLQASWQEYLDVKVQIIENLPFDEIAANLAEGSIQLALMGWAVDYPDPDNILRGGFFYGSSPMNCLGWKNKAFDELVEQAAGTSQQTRLALYHQADKILVAEETAIVPLYYRWEYSLLRRGFRLNGAGKIIHGGAFKWKNISAV